MHLAVTLKGRLGTLYVNGAAVGSNPDIDLAPFQLGSTHQNWLGRSQYSGDPYFNGKMQDLQIYSGALTDTEIAALIAELPGGRPTRRVPCPGVSTTGGLSTVSKPACRSIPR